MTELDFAWAELSARRAIAERDLSKIQRLILEAILDLSFRACWAKAYVPRLDVLVQATKVTRGNVSETLAWLAAQKVIEERPPLWYGINVTFSDWSIPTRVKSGVYPRQPELELVPPDLQDALRETFVESRGGIFIHQARAPRGGADLATREPGASRLSRVERMEGSLDVRTGPKRGPLPSSSDGIGVSGGVGMIARSTPAPSPDSSTGPARVREESAFQNPERRVPENGTGVPENGTGVPESGTSVPFSGTQKVSSPTPPLSKTLNVERSTLNVKALGKETRPAPSREEEERLLELIAQFVGSDDMARSGPFWRAVVRRYPHRIEEAVGEGRYKSQTGTRWEIGPAAWLNNYIARLEGLKSLAGICPRRERV